MSRVSPYLCQAACSLHGFCVQMLNSFVCLCDGGFGGPTCAEAAPAPVEPVVDVVSVGSGFSGWWVFLAFFFLFLFAVVCSFLGWAWCRDPVLPNGSRSVAVQTVEPTAPALV